MRCKDGDAGEMEIRRKRKREKGKFVIPGAGVACIQVALKEIKKLKNIEKIRQIKLYET